MEGVSQKTYNVLTLKSDIDFFSAYKYISFMGAGGLILFSVHFNRGVDIFCGMQAKSYKYRACFHNDYYYCFVSAKITLPGTHL